MAEQKTNDDFKITLTAESRGGGRVTDSKTNLPEFAVIAAQLRKTYFQGDRELQVLRGMDFEIKNGEIVAVVGPSGAGKSTLLHSVGLMETLTSGNLTVLGWEINNVSDPEKDVLRNKYIGFLFQFHYLLGELTLLENAALPMRIHGMNPREAEDRATELLNSVGLKDRVTHYPSEVSGGEQQRIALARALANEPALLLCDAPTGNLDLERGEEVRDLISRTARARHSTVMIATHNPDIAKKADRI